MNRFDALDGGAEVRQENNVAIRIANYIVPRQFLRSREHIVDTYRPECVALHHRLVAKPQFLGNFRRPGIIAKQNNFHIAIQQHPAFQRIALNDAVVTFEWLRGCKKRNHVYLF
jgi:hypothetical protein